VNFYKTSLYSGLYSVINLITGLVITKLTASLIGPVGTAYIGKFGNISGLILVFSTASIATGIIKYVSEYKDNKPELIKVINSAFGIILTGSVIASLFVFASYKIFILFGVFIFIISSQVLFTGILNGLGEIKLLSYINIAAALLNLLFTSYFIYEYRIAGALFSNSLYGIFVTLSGLFALHKLNILRKEYFRPKIDLAIARNLIKYGLFAAITSFSWMGSMLVIREMVENHLSTVDAGLWQAMFSLSDRYLAVITSMLIVYFIPTLSSINETPELVREIRKGFKRIIPLMIFISGGIWLCKDLIISILLAESFRPMRDLFTFQMMGDVFRISAAILGYLIASKAMFRSGLKADLSFHAILILSSYFFLIHYGLIGMSYAYALSTLLYLMIYLFIFKDLMVLIKKSVLPKPWLK
jgi:O-antigen/teichoic acid export membrane protein